MAPADHGSAEQSDKINAHCSFCRKSFRDVGPLAEGPGTGTGSVYICRDCATLVIEVIDHQDRVRRGEAPTRMEMIEYFTKALDRLEALSRQRELTEIELDRKQRIEADLEGL
jgi:ATP-dependent Clp protease ATP-binding subunit ClpX